MSNLDPWPRLPLKEWQDTYHTLHLWTQIIGKIRMMLSPPLNHWWHVTLYVNSRGLTTGPVPYGPGIFEIQLDFQKHTVEIATSEATNASRPLKPESVAAFYAGISECLALLGIAVEINPRPQEIADAVPFDRDVAHCSYDSEYAHRFWRILVSTAKVMEQFRGRFTGKCSPVHFFWGGFDLACTRFSGRKAPPRRGVISGPAYSLFLPAGSEAMTATIRPESRVGLLTSSMSPVIVLRDGKPRYALGLPGGLRIFPSVMQALSNLIDHGMSVQP